MMKLFSRLLTMAMALLFSLSCFIIPTLAADVPSHLDVQLNQQGRNFTYYLLDENGNPVLTPYSLPVEGTSTVSLQPMHTIVITETGGGAFNIPAACWISFEATLSTSAGLAFGCQRNGTNWWKYDEAPSKSHTSSFRLDSGGSIKFIIKNTSATATTLTYLHIW